MPIRREAAQRLREVILSGDERRLADTLEDLFVAMEPEAALIRDAAISQRQARELAEATRLRAWIEKEASGRTEDTRAQARELNELLRKWFSSISITVESDTVVISATRLKRANAAAPPNEVRIDRAAWGRFAPLTRRSMVRYAPWNDAEIIGALQAWADVHGRSPASADWARSSAIYPAAPTVRHHFGTFNGGVRAAGLEPEPRRPRGDTAPGTTST